jgi:hypothetical protein
MTRKDRLIPPPKQTVEADCAGGRKIVVRYDGENCLAACSAMHGNPFHIVDLIGKIGLDHSTAID